MGVHAKELPDPVASVPSQRPEPPVMETQKSDHAVPAVPKAVKEVPTAKLVVEAVVAKKLVVVAEVPVAFAKVKFCKVEEPMTRRSPDELMVVVAVPPILKELPVNKLAKELVEVALVVVEFPLAIKSPF